MHPIVIGVILLLAGLAICWLHKEVVQPLFAMLIYYTGAIIAVLGLLIIIMPVVNWVYGHFKEAFGL